MRHYNFKIEFKGSDKLKKNDKLILINQKNNQEVVFYKLSSDSLFENESTDIFTTFEKSDYFSNLPNSPYLDKKSKEPIDSIDFINYREINVKDELVEFFLHNFNISNKDLYFKSSKEIIRDIKLNLILAE